MTPRAVWLALPLGWFLKALGVVISRLKFNQGTQSQVVCVLPYQLSCVVHHRVRRTRIADSLVCNQAVRD